MIDKKMSQSNVTTFDLRVDLGISILYLGNRVFTPTWELLNRIKESELTITGKYHWLNNLPNVKFIPEDSTITKCRCLRIDGIDFTLLAKHETGDVYTDYLKLVKIILNNV